MEGTRSKKKLLNFGLLTGMLVSLVFLLITFTTTSKCYLDPCYTLDAQEYLYQVPKGAGFMLITSALLTLASGIGNLYVLNKALESDYAYGLAIGCTSMTALMLFEQTIFWGGQAAVINDLPDSMMINADFGPNFGTSKHFHAVATFAAVLFLGEIAIASSFVLYRTQIIMGGHGGYHPTASDEHGISSQAAASASNQGSMAGTSASYQESAPSMNQVDL